MQFCMLGLISASFTYWLALFIFCDFFHWMFDIIYFRYQKRVKEYSFIYHDRLTPPGKVLSHWVSHVIRTNGAHYLRSPAFLVPWYQKMYIDLQVVLLILLYLLLWILTKVLNKLMMLGRKLITIKHKILYLFFSFLTIYIHIHHIYIKPT